MSQAHITVANVIETPRRFTEGDKRTSKFTNDTT